MLGKRSGQFIDAENIIDTRIYQAGRDIVLNVPEKKEIGFVLTVNNFVDIIPTSFFHGRDLQIEEIKKFMSEGKQKTILIYGMGGIGKTEICRTIYREYLDKHHIGEKIEFNHIAYLKYENNIDETLVNAFQSYLTVNTWEEKIEQAWSFLLNISNESNVLLILDGVNKQISDDFNLGRLNSLSCCILLSSRNKSFKDFYPYEISLLDYVSCKAIFCSIYGTYENTEEIDLMYVIDELANRHTLTVKLFACIARDNVWTIEELKKILIEKHFNISYINDGQEEVLIEEYKKLFELSSLNDWEINILESFSIFPYLMLPIKYCNNWLSDDVGMDSVALLINGLNQKGWLECEDRKFAMHPVISETIRSVRDISLENHKKLLLSCIESLVSDINKLSEMEISYGLYAESLIKYLFNENSLEIAELSSNNAWLAYHQANYTKALEYNEKALLIREKILGCIHPLTASTYNNIAGVYHDLGQYVIAQEWNEKALSVRESVLNNNHPDIAISYQNLAATCRQMGNYKEALNYNKKALLIRETVFGFKNKETATSYAKIADIYYDLGNYEIALEFFNKALSIFKEIDEQDDFGFGMIYNNIAGVYDSQGKYKNALEFYEKALVMQKRVFGENNREIATTYNNIGEINRRLGNYEQALEFYDKSLTMRLEILGRHHPDIGMSYNNIGGIYHSMKEYGRALEFYKKSLSISKKTYDKKHPTIAKTYNNIAGVYHLQKKYREAIELYKKSLCIMEEKLGLAHPDIATIYNNIAAIYQEQGKTENALEWHNKALNIQKKKLGENHPIIATTYNNIAIDFYSLGDNEKATQFMKRAYEISAINFGVGHPDTLHIYKNLIQLTKI